MTRFAARSLLSPRVFTALACAFVSIACGSRDVASPAVSDVRIVVAGSSTVQPVMEVIAERFEAKHPSIKVDIQGGGSSVGISAPRSGLAQVGMVSRALKDEEKVDLVATTIAHDGIALVVHATNPLAAMTRDDVIRVFSGAVSNWKELGGRDAPITVINKEEGRSTLELFEQHFGLKGKFVKNAIIIGPNGQALATVAGNPDAVAYVSIGSAETAAKEGAPVRLLSLDGVTATVDNVKNGSYPLRRELTLTTRGAATGAVKQLLAFVVGPEGQRVVEEQSFVPGIATVPVPAIAR